MTLDDLRQHLAWVDACDSFLSSGTVSPYLKQMLENAQRKAVEDCREHLINEMKRSGVSFEERA